MDTPKLVKRTQTLKIKNYGGTPDKAVNAGSSNQPKKSTSKELQTKSKSRRSVILKSVQDLTPGLNARDERLLKVLSSQPDQPLIEINTSGDSGCSSSSDNFQVLAGTDLPLSRQELIDDTENTPPTSRQQNKTSLHDPTDIYQPQAVTQRQQNKRTVGNGAIMEEERCKTPKNAMLCSMNSNENFPVTPSALHVDSRLLTRIQHDLNSPSASIRVRALKAIRSPAKSSYAHFDVSYTEQSLITEAERHPPKPKSMEELMQDIVVYVEVRSGEDNRSAGVKKVISSLGAKVNDRLLRNTTHVIFKDGLLSTYKKAKYWNIPVVSILWIEACKNHRRICDVNEFPISNLDRYENPELYGKVKRYKIIQSDSDVHKRVAHKTATTTPKTTTPRTGGNSKKNHVVNAETPKTSSIKKKTDIRDFFTKLNDNNKIHPKPSGRNLFGSPKTSKVPSKEKVTESHTKIQKLHKSGNVSTFQETNPVNSVAKADKAEKPLLQSPSADFDTAFQHIKSVVNNHNALQRSLENTITAVQDMSLDQMPVAESSKTDTPINRTERRRSIRISAYASASKDKEATDFAKKYQREDKIAEEYENNAAAARSNRKRKTNYTPKAMDISEMENSEPELVIESGSKQKDADSKNLAHQDLRTPTKQSASDVTLHNCSLTAITAKLAQINKDMEMLKPTSDVVVASSLSDISQSECAMQTPPQEAGSLLEQHASVNVFSSTRLPGRRRTLFDVSMDIITQRLQNINNSARRSVARTNLHEKTDTTSDSPMLYEKTATSTLATKQTSDVSESLQLTEEHSKPLAADDCSSDKTDKPSDSTTMIVAKKKRKLFDPNEYPATPPTATVSTTSIVSKTAATARRRRTLMPLPQAELQSKTESSTAADTEKLTIKRTRRSTMDFEETKKVKMNLVTLKKFTKLARETNAAAMAEYKRDVDALRLQEGVTVGDSAASSPRSVHLAEMEQHRTPTVLVYTNMHAEQVKTIREALAKLGHFELENEVNNRTTHIVSLEPRRTMNMLRALLRGLWILQYNWITDSLLAGKWLNEEPYEMRDFSRSVEICRSERQAFGKEYSCELFSMLGPFYVPIRCGRLHKDNLVELIELSGGKIVEQRRSAKYIVGNANKTVDDKVYITPNWIVDSITQMQCQRFGKYAKNKKNGSTGSQPSDVKLQNVWQPNLPK